MQAIISLITIAGLFFATCSEARAQIVSILATVDGDVRGARAGGQIPRSVDDTSTEVNAQISGSLQDRGVWEFDLSSVQSQVIDSATLDLTVSGTIVHPAAASGDGPARLNFFGHQGNGIIDTDDYAAPGATLISTFTFPTANNGEPPSGTQLSFDLDMTLLQQAADNGGFFGIRVQQAFNFSGFSVRSLEHASPSGKPTLVLNTTAVPEPSGLTAMALLFPVICLFRRRQRPSKVCVRGIRCE